MVYATVNCTAPIRRATGRRRGWAEQAGRHPEGGGCTGWKDLADWGLVVRALLKKEPAQAEAGSRGRHNLWEAGRWTRPGWRCKPARGYASRALLSPHRLSSALSKTEMTPGCYLLDPAAMLLTKHSGLWPLGEKQALSLVLGGRSWQVRLTRVKDKACAGGPWGGADWWGHWDSFWQPFLLCLE